MYLDDLKSYRLEAVADKHDENLDLSKSRFTQCLVKLLGPTRSLCAFTNEITIQIELDRLQGQARRGCKVGLHIGEWPYPNSKELQWPISKDYYYRIEVLLCDLEVLAGCRS